MSKPLRGYFDDTGHHDPTGKKAGADVAGVVGYVATDRKWGKFDLAWRVPFKDEGINVEDFHAFDLQWKRGAFAGWSDTRRDDFADRLANVIYRFTDFGVGGLVLVKDFDTMPQKFKDEIEEPFFIGVHNLLKRFIHGPFVPELRGRKVNLCFERMKPVFEAKIVEMFTRIRDRQASHVFKEITTGGSPENLLPLQAADFAAYQVRAEISRLKYKPHLQVRPAMEALKQRYRIDVAYSDREALRNLYFKLTVERALIS